MAATAQTNAGAHLFQASTEQWAGIAAILGPGASGARVLVVMSPGQENIRSVGRFQYRDGFEDVWLGEEHFDLRKHTKARLCLEYLVANLAYTAKSARHFLDEIDPYVREKGGFIKLAEIRMQDYFRDPSGRLAKLRQGLVARAGQNGKYYLRTDAA